MTLIVSHFSKYGIFQMSDSNLTTKHGNAGFGQKIFPVPHLNASVAYTGVYWVRDQQLDDWMNNFIEGTRYTGVKNIEELVAELVCRLNSDLTATAKESPIILHIAGYDRVDHKSFARHYHISNCSMQEDGHYGEIRENFNSYKDLDSESGEARRKMSTWKYGEGAHAMYANGEREGRAAFMTMTTEWPKLLDSLWLKQKEGWHFREPKSIYEIASVIRHYFDFVCHLYKMSTHEALYVGGEIQTHYIIAPHDLDLD
jgi:hypothetical protein